MLEILMSIAFEERTYEYYDKNYNFLTGRDINKRLVMIRNLEKVFESLDDKREIDFNDYMLRWGSYQFLTISE